MAGCEVREADPEELDVLEREMPTGGSRFHEIRLQGQQTGYATYLVAWLDGRPAGHLFLKWHGADEEVVHRHIGDIPEFNAISVQPTLRSRGIGSTLIGVAERLALERGHAKVGLAVGTDNDRAHALYRRLGFRDWGHGTYRTAWLEMGPDGRKREASEEVVYMTKDLQAGRKPRA